MLIYYLALIDDEPSRSLFEQIYLSHRQTMVYTANQILHDQALAEDATHDAFLRIINHLEKIHDPHCHKTRSFVVLIVTVRTRLHRQMVLRITCLQLSQRATRSPIACC